MSSTPDYRPCSKKLGRKSGGDHEGRDRADDHRVDEGLKHGDEALGERLIRAHGGVGDRRRADAGFVGEGGSSETEHDDTEHATDGTVRRKGLSYDSSERVRKTVDISADDVEPCRDVERGHGGDEACGHACDDLDAAENDRRDTYSEE